MFALCTVGEKTLQTLPHCCSHIWFWGGCSYFEQYCSVLSMLGRMPSPSRAAQAALSIVGLPIKLMLPAVCSFVCPARGCGAVLHAASLQHSLVSPIVWTRRGSYETCTFRKERGCKGTSGNVNYARKQPF